MKRSQINELVRAADECFRAHGWALPPSPRWDVTDFGLGDPDRFGLVLVNLADEPEYCEKLMYARGEMTTPAHCHARKKEDIVARCGGLRIRLWADRPEVAAGRPVTVRVDGEPITVASGAEIEIRAGSRVTLVPGVYHEFRPATPECIVGEVSTANDDLHDNLFANPNVGRYPGVEEDEPPIVRLVSDRDPPEPPSPARDPT